MSAPWTGGAQVRIKGTLHGQDTVNVLNFATNVAISDAGDATPLMVALLAAVIECVVEALLPAVTQEWRFTSVDGRFIYNSGALAINNNPMEQVPDGGIQVGDNGPCSVSFAAALMSVRTAQGGRSGRGRVFLPPPGESTSFQSTMDGTAATLFAAFAACLAGKFIGSGATEQWRIGVLSRKLAGKTNATFDAGFFEATTLTFATDLAVLTKRKKGHGR